MNESVVDFDEDVGFLSNLVQENEEDEPDRLLQEVQKLTLKVKHQEQMIKERDVEIKRLKLTTISSCLNPIFING